MKLKAGVLGAGHLGKIHIKLLKELDELYDFVGFYDMNPEHAAQVAEEFNTKAFATVDELIDAVDMVDIVTPTLSHYECASKAMRKSKHTFIEKPITNTVEEAKNLISLAEEADVKVQVGHVERFNPAFQASLSYFDQPMFIEGHRLAQFNPRGTDVPVVLDLMIHDIDLVLAVVKSTVRRISASGVAVVSDTPDIANARIEFDNGCVANLTASRISMKNMRKMRYFQKNAYIAVDFLERETEIIKMKDLQGESDDFSLVLDVGEGKPKKEIFFEKPEISPNNAIKDELESFYHAIVNNTTPRVTVDDGYEALRVAHQVMEKLSVSSGMIQE